MTIGRKGRQGTGSQLMPGSGRVRDEDWFHGRYVDASRGGRTPADPIVVSAGRSGLIAACRRVGLANGQAETRAALDALFVVLEKKNARASAPTAKVES